jgi:hypothetical protein
MGMQCFHEHDMQVKPGHRMRHVLQKARLFRFCLPHQGRASRLRSARLGFLRWGLVLFKNKEATDDVL